MVVVVIVIIIVIVVVDVVVAVEAWLTAPDFSLLEKKNHVILSPLFPFFYSFLYFLI